MSRDSAMVTAGGICLAVGLFFLLVAPNNSGSDVANLHRLTLGQTFSIVGVMIIIGGAVRSAYSRTREAGVGNTNVERLAPMIAVSEAVLATPGEQSPTQREVAGEALETLGLPRGSVGNRLEELAVLRDRGLVSDEEYSRKRQRIIDEL